MTRFKVIDNTEGKGFTMSPPNKLDTLNVLLAKVGQEKHLLMQELKFIDTDIESSVDDNEIEKLEQQQKGMQKRLKVLESTETRLSIQAKSLKNPKLNKKVVPKVETSFSEANDTIVFPENFNSFSQKQADNLPFSNEFEIVKENFEIVQKSAPIVGEVKEPQLTEAQVKAKELLAEWGIDSRTSFREEYQERLLKTDYFSAFKLLTVRINAIPDEEDKQELEDFFFNYKEVLRVAADKDLVSKYALYLADFIKDVELSKENKEYLVYLFPIAAMSLCFSVLVSGGALNKATILKPYINNNLNAYPNVLKDLITQNKIEALDYLMENTINTNFNNNEIMNLLMGLSSYEKIYYFFDKYDLSINAKLAVSHHNPNISAPEWNTLFARVVESKNYALFEKMMDNAKQRPALSVLIRREEKIKHYSVFYLIRNESDFSRYVEKALTYNDINNNEINGILSLLMQNPHILMNNINSGIVDKIFNHPNLTSVSFIEGTVHLFGFLSCADYWCQSNMGEVVLDGLRYVLDKFLTRFPDTDNIPVGTSVNMYGSTVYLLAQNNDPKLFKLLYPILIHYRDWINVENPCGKTPIEFVSSNDTKLKDVLLRLGAVERKTSLVSKLAFWKKKEVQTVDFTPKVSLSTPSYNSPQNSGDKTNIEGSGEDVEQEMRDSFNRVRPTLKKVPLDIRLACEEMFLNAENLLILTAQAEKGKFNEDVFFLIQTFNDYLPSILDTYLGSIDLEFIQNSSKANQSNEDKAEVLKQLGMLNNHINKLRENIELKMKKTLNMDIKKNTEFLKSRLGTQDDEGSKKVQEIESSLKKDAEEN